MLFWPVQPSAVGVKVMLKFTLCPSANTAGKERLEVVNTELLDDTPVMVTLDEVVLVTVASTV